MAAQLTGDFCHLQYLSEGDRAPLLSCSSATCIYSGNFNDWNKVKQSEANDYIFLVMNLQFRSEKICRINPLNSSEESPTLKVFLSFFCCFSFIP